MSDDPTTRSTKLARGQRSLLARPQRLGVLPTMWFWQDAQNWRLVRVPFVVLLVTTTLILMLVEAPVWAVLLLPSVPFLLALGLLERYVRARAAAARRANESAMAPGNDHETSPGR